IKKTPYLGIALTAFLLGNQSVYAEDSKQNFISTYDETAVGSLLLAAGMYGGLNNNDSSPGVSLSLGQQKNIMKGLFTDQGQFDGQDITLSYEGSEGRLGFSAGYIYATGEKNPNGTSVLLGFDNYYSKNTLNSMQERPWYVTVDLSRSFQVGDNFAVGVGSKAVLLSNNLDEENSADKAVSMTLNLPVSYKGFLTITPEFQWSRPLLTDGEQGSGGGDAQNLFDAENGQDAFYGGMSISFSY
ncbi:MAG: hypothetical protein D3908_05865, partial [Candidatus Electrothrix sp. AUS4]|nr:hypothetical protein [Candidatus Electrothrix sp. AUS4]